MKKILFLMLISPVIIAQTTLTLGRIDTIWAAGKVPTGANNTNTWYTLYNRVSTGSITGSGTINFIPLWSGTNTQTSSFMHQNGSGILFGNGSNADIFDYAGSNYIRMHDASNGITINSALGITKIVSPLQYTGSAPHNGYFLQEDGSGNITPAAVPTPISGLTTGRFTIAGSSSTIVNSSSLSDDLAGDLTGSYSSGVIFTTPQFQIIGSTLFGSPSVSAGQINFANGSNTHIIGLKASNSTSAGITYNLPFAGPSINGQVLAATTAGQMSWITPSVTGWSITGNSGIVDGTNFIGPINDAPFNIQIDGVEAGRIDADNFNTFLGNAVGGGYTITGTGNVGLSSGGMGLSSGNNNSCVGAGSMQSIGAGSNNTGLGYLSLSATSGSGNIALGAYAGEYETRSNYGYINNQDRSNLKGDTTKSIAYWNMGVDSSKSKWTFNSKLTINDGSQSTGYVWTATDSKGSGHWAASSGGSGTVTSIATTAPIGGGTITTSGTITCTTCAVATSPGVGVAHFAGSTQTMTSSLIVNADITNSTIDLTAKVTGALPVGNGGTGLASYTTGDLIKATGSTTLASLPDVAVGSVLASGGTSTAPTYSSSPTLTTSLTTPLDIGGTTASSTKSIESTSGTGTSDYINFLTGSQVEAARITTGGVFCVGATSANFSQDLVSITKSTNAPVNISVENINTGNSAYAQLRTQNASHYAIFGMVGTGTTTSGNEIQDGSYFETSGSGGASFAATANAPMTFWTNGSKRVNIDGSGQVGVGNTNTTYALDVTGEVAMNTVGKTLRINTSSNGCMGTGTLSGGTVTVSTTCIGTTSAGIFITDTNAGGVVNVGSLAVTSVSSGASFTVTSTNALDASTFNWIIFKAY